jgi:hypothetical protein
MPWLQGSGRWTVPSPQSLNCQGAPGALRQRAQLPPEWTAFDTATTERKAREFLQKRFEDCYPFHPATLSVYQHKWQALPQYQQTRGTLAMLAQWISWAAREAYQQARREALISLGSAPLHVPEFRSVILGQLGEPRLLTAIDTDLAGVQSHARPFDADTKGPLRDIHRRVGTAILFESSGGQVDKVAHLPELRFALGDPGVDTTSVDNAALVLEAKAYFLRKVGTDGFWIGHQATLKKVVSDRRASLDPDTEIKPAIRSAIQKEFDKGASIPLVLFPSDSTTAPDSPRLTLVLIDPEFEWTASGSLREQMAAWTKYHGASPRLYPGSLVWCLRKPGRDLRDKVEISLAWKRVVREVAKGTLGSDFDRADWAEIQGKVADAEEDVGDEVWASYRFTVIADKHEPNGLKPIDLGAGHASASETLCGRIIAALKSDGLLNESVGAGYLERNWPPALKDAAALPLTSLRQSFLNGALTRLLDPDTILRRKIVEFIEKGDFGLASGQQPNGTYERIWYAEAIGPDEVSFEANVFLLTKAKVLKAKAEPQLRPDISPQLVPEPQPMPEPQPQPPPSPHATNLRLVGTVPPEVWNRLGVKLLSKLRSGDNLKVGVDFSVTVKGEIAQSMETELHQALEDLGLQHSIQIEHTQ